MMYVINGVAYAGEKQKPIRVKSVRPLDGYKLWIRFTTNEVKVFDFSSLLGFPAYVPLKEKSLFEQVYVDFGTVVWEDGKIDIAPERLYADGIPLEDNKSA